MYSDSLDSEQGKKEEGKYLSVRAISEMSDAEQDKYFLEGLDPQLVLENQKKWGENGQAQLGVSESGDFMGGSVGECGGDVKLFMTVPTGHANEGFAIEEIGPTV